MRTMMECDPEARVAKASSMINGPFHSNHAPDVLTKRKTRRRNRKSIYQEEKQIESPRRTMAIKHKSVKLRNSAALKKAAPVKLAVSEESREQAQEPHLRTNHGSFPSFRNSYEDLAAAMMGERIARRSTVEQNKNLLHQLPTLDIPEALPGDCNVPEYILQNITPYHGDEAFLAKPTERTLKSWKRCEELMELELERGILDVDTKTPSTITSHKPGYVLSKEEDVICGLQTDEPLKRSCKPKGGFGVVKKALESYGYSADPEMKKIYTEQVQTHNDLVFSMYSKEMRAARHAHLLTGLPDAYGRGRLVADYRRIALYGVDELIRRKKMDYNSIPGASDEALLLRSEVTKQVKAFQELLVMGDSYGVDLRKPASTFREAAQVM